MKRFLLFMFVCGSAFGQTVHWTPSPVQVSVNGFVRAVAGATVTICSQGSTGIPCTPVVQTGSADANGNINITIQPGTYDYTVTGTGLTGFKQTVTIPPDPSNINNIIFVDGVTYGATGGWANGVTQADTYLGSTCGTIWVTTAVAGTTSSVAPTVSQCHALHFEPGIYSLSVGWTITNLYKVSVTAPRFLVTIQFTGSAGFTVTGAGLSNGSYGDDFSGLIFSGNSSVPHAATFIDVDRSHLDIAGRNSSGQAIDLEGCVLIQKSVIAVSSNMGTFTDVPGGGLLLDEDASNTPNADNELTVIIEGVTTGTGVELKHAQGTTLTGTIEGNAGQIGLKIDSGVINTTTINLDTEANATDYSMAGIDLNIIDGICASSTRVSITGAGNMVSFFGGDNGSTSCAIQPTISSGFGTSPSIVQQTGTAAFTINVGTSNTGTGVVTMPTAAHGWSCTATDTTTTSTTVSQTKVVPTSVTSVTFQNYTDISGTHAWVDSDVLAVNCNAY